MTVDFTLADKNKAVAGLAMGLAMLALTSCNRHPPVVAKAPPPQPVGHVYPTQVAVPPPVSPRIHFTASQEAQAQQAFNVIGLKSALMVAALTCGDQPEYDSFMRTFQPHVLAEQHVIDAYFYKASGPYSGQKMEDNFVTLLANNQSVGGIGQGRDFCLNSQAEFTAVAALKTPQQLDNFVTDEAPGMLASPAPGVVVASTRAPAHDEHVTQRGDPHHERYRHDVHYRVTAKHTVVKTAAKAKGKTAKVSSKAEADNKKVVASQP